jgi:hypothetical protein
MLRAAAALLAATAGMKAEIMFQQEKSSVSIGRSTGVIKGSWMLA